jgi:hypothetical protein
MKLSKVVGICAIAFLLITWGITQTEAQQRVVQEPTDVQEATEADAQEAEGGPELTLSGSLGSFDAVDVYRVDCLVPSGPPRPRCVRANVCDAGPVNDTEFQVHLIGRSGTKVTGKVDYQQGPAAGCSGFAQLCRPSDGAISAWVIISEANQAGSENYSTTIECRSASGVITPHTVKQNQDQ